MVDFAEMLAKAKARKLAEQQGVVEALAPKASVIPPPVAVTATPLPKSSPIVPTPLNNADQIINRITTLQQQLQEASPAYESSLFTIHKALLNDPDVVHLLSDEQVGIIVSGLAKRKGIVIAESESKASAKKKLAGVTLNDL